MCPLASKAIGNPDGSPFISDNIHRKRKKTKTFGLASHHQSLDRVARCARTPCPAKRPTAKAVVRTIHTVACAVHHGYAPMNHPDTVYFTLLAGRETN